MANKNKGTNQPAPKGQSPKGQQPKAEQKKQELPPGKSEIKETSALKKADITDALDIASKEVKDSSESIAPKTPYDFTVLKNNSTKSNQSDSTVRDNFGGFCPHVKKEYVRINMRGEPNSPQSGSFARMCSRLYNTLKMLTNLPTSTNMVAVTPVDCEQFFEIAMEMYLLVWTVSFIWALVKDVDTVETRVAHRWASTVNSGANLRLASSSVPSVIDLTKNFPINKNIIEFVDNFCGIRGMSENADGTFRLHIIEPVLNLELLTGGVIKIKEFVVKTSADIDVVSGLIRNGLLSFNTLDPRLVSFNKVSSLMAEVLNSPEGTAIYKVNFKSGDYLNLSKIRPVDSHSVILFKNRNRRTLNNGVLLNPNVVTDSSIGLYAPHGSPPGPADWVFSESYSLDSATKVYTPLVGFISDATTALLLKATPCEWFVDSTFLVSSTSFSNEVSTFDRKLRQSSAQPSVYRVVVNYDVFTLHKYDTSNVPYLLDEWNAYLLCIKEIESLNLS